MTDYIVTIPFTGYIAIGLSAENEDQAKELAWQALNSDYVETTINTVKTDKCPGHIDYAETEEWQFHRQICQGNVLYALQNEVEVEQI